MVPPSLTGVFSIAGRLRRPQRDLDTDLRRPQRVPDWREARCALRAVDMPQRRPRNRQNRPFQRLAEMRSKGPDFGFGNEPTNQLLDDQCDHGNPLSLRSAQLSVPADRRGYGTAQVGTPRRGRNHVCSPHHRARTPTKMSQSIASVLRASFEPQVLKWIRNARRLSPLTCTCDWRPRSRGVCQARLSQDHYHRTPIRERGLE